VDNAVIQEFFGRLMDVEEARAWREQLRERRKCVVFTGGCFDLLHAGHVDYLAWARAQGDALVVGLNHDDSVRALKGERRPIIGFQARARLLLALRSVDVVFGFHERTPEAVLARIRPDILVKSAQYREDELPERTVVREHGGEIRLAPHLAGVSSTGVIGEIVSRYTS
jgi:rfaE bifunctional protein nucleotidyltransferase chain/domain